MSHPSKRISQQELESYLWGAAVLLRGLIDAGDYKQFIFPLLFFKRVSDVWNEEYQAAVANSNGDLSYAQFAENHRFAIPEGHHWEDVRNRTENIGTALQTAFREIEKANPETLYGIFGNTSWTNKDKLPDRKLADLIEHFSTRTLSNAAVAPDVFGNAYEYLIKRFADQSNKKAGEYYTPRSVVRLLINILNPVDGESVYDPACGTGGMLIEVIERSKVEDRAETIILGCAGMSSLCERLAKATGVPVIDGVTAALKIAEALVGAGYSTSKVNAYDYPRQKEAPGAVVESRRLAMNS